MISGAVEHGNHFTLNLVYEHILDRTSYSFTYGPFGGVKGMQLIHKIVQLFVSGTTFFLFMEVSWILESCFCFLG